MLKRLNKKDLDIPVFNLRVSRDKIMSSKKGFYMTSHYIGEFVVYNSGRLERSFHPDLHTYETWLGTIEDHLHIGNFEADISMKKGETRLLRKFGTPHLTLSGFYSQINPEDSKQEESLTKYIKEFNPKFQFNSIATHEKTKLKLLENAYRRYVSNQ